MRKEAGDDSATADLSDAQQNPTVQLQLICGEDAYDEWRVPVKIINSRCMAGKPYKPHSHD